MASLTDIALAMSACQPNTNGRALPRPARPSLPRPRRRRRSPSLNAQYHQSSIHHIKASINNQHHVGVYHEDHRGEWQGREVGDGARDWELTF